MKINKLTATFGKLEKDTLRLHDGLNVIYAPNESGKSTWCAFIKAMLYGVDSAQRSRAGYLPDKLRYAPWSGAPMEGSMELTADKCDITISRTTRSKSAPMREFSATYTGSAIPVENVNAANAGEMFTGVNREVFNRSAFIAQGTMAVTGGPELEKRISAIVSTGEEQCSFTEADTHLKTWQRRRRFNQHGLLPQLEADMDEAEKELAEMSRTSSEIAELTEKLENNRHHCAELEVQVTESRKQQRKNALESLHSGRAELKSISEKHDQALAELSMARAELRASPFGELSEEEILEQAEADRYEYRRLKGKKISSLKAAFAMLCFVLSIVFAALYTDLQAVWAVALAALFCVAAAVLLISWSMAGQERRRRSARREEILQKYAASNLNAMDAAVEQQLQLISALSEAEEEEKLCRELYEQARQRQEQREEAAMGDLDFAGGSSQAALLGRELAELRHQSQELSALRSQLQGRLAAMGDPMVLKSRLGVMEEEYEQLNLEYEAISLAADTLRDADTQIQSRFSPELGKLAAHYMSLMTAGRYSDVLLNRDFTAKIRAQEDVVARESEYLSAGTLDLMYFAVRLAVCELALPQGESCPLIIDDSLVNLDDTRYAQAIELLKEIAQKRQVILFTCRK